MLPQVQDNGPGALAGLEPYFDFIISLDGVRLDTSSHESESGGETAAAGAGGDRLKQLLRRSLGRSVQAHVFSSKSNIVRLISITPRDDWGGQGLLGVSIRYCSFEKAREHVWHILEVSPNSPAQSAGLKSYSDFIIGADSLVQEHEDLFALIEAHDQHQLKLFVYNYVTDQTREVVITPNSAWGGQGLLGCDIGYGYLHRIPSRPPGELPTHVSNIEQSQQQHQLQQQQQQQILQQQPQQKPQQQSSGESKVVEFSVQGPNINGQTDSCVKSLENLSLDKPVPTSSIAPSGYRGPPVSSIGSIGSPSIQPAKSEPSSIAAPVSLSTSTVPVSSVSSPATFIPPVAPIPASVIPPPFTPGISSNVTPIAPPSSSYATPSLSYGHSMSTSQIPPVSLPSYSNASMMYPSSIANASSTLISTTSYPISPYSFSSLPSSSIPSVQPAISTGSSALPSTFVPPTAPNVSTSTTPQLFNPVSGSNLNSSSVQPPISTATATTTGPMITSSIGVEGMPPLIVSAPILPNLQLPTSSYGFHGSSSNTAGAGQSGYSGF